MYHELARKACAFNNCHRRQPSKGHAKPHANASACSQIVRSESCICEIYMYYIIELFALLL
jgi:hypothetical protein